ncbi:MAG: hypothetical protein J0L75_04380 [Spirochaetes bacterium]|nr:hypothetical protein [Spirochaetota bacterium]
MVPLLRRSRNAFFIAFAALLFLKAVFHLGRFEFTSVRLNYALDLVLLGSLVLASLWVFLFVDFPWSLLNRLKDTLAVLGIFGTIMISVIYLVLALGILSRGIDPSFIPVARVEAPGGSYGLYRGPGLFSNDFSLTVRREKEAFSMRRYETLLEAKGLLAWTNLESNGVRLLSIARIGGSNEIFRYP